MPSKNDALPTGGPVEPSEDYKAETWALRVRQLEAEVAKQTARANAATKIANLTAGDLASEREAHATTKDQYRQQIRLSQDLERTANGFQQRIAALTADCQRASNLIGELQADLKNKTARVEELNKDLKGAWATVDAQDAELKDLRAKAAERDITFQHNTELASALADANQKIEGLEAEALDDTEVITGHLAKIETLENDLRDAEAQRDEARTSYHQMYDARAKVAAQLSEVLRDTRDYDALRRTIRVVYAVVKVALNDLTATDGDALDDDANPDAAAQGLADALMLLDASGAFAHRSDR